MKKALSLILAFLMCLSLCACGSSGDSTAPKAENGSSVEVPQTEKTPAIDVKGYFLLEPSDELDWSDEGLADVQRYFLVVFDVENKNAANEELSSFGDSITATFNGANTYEQLYTNDGNVLETFRKNCGYAISTSYGTLWGSSDPVRMVAAFAINGNDVKGECTAEIAFELSDNLKAKTSITAEDIKTIHWLDGIFSVESDPDAYQITRSVVNRAQICKTALEVASQANKNKDVQLRNTQLALCGTIFSEKSAWGVSCSATTVTSEMPTFNIESVRKYNPDVAEQIATITESINVMVTELEKSSPNYDSVNTAQRTAYNTLGDVIKEFS